MEVGKFYQNSMSGRIVKALAVATDGSVFVETTKPSVPSINTSGTNSVGRAQILNRESLPDWKEHTPVQTLWVNIYRNARGTYNTGVALYDTQDKAEKAAGQGAGWKNWIKTIPIEV